MNCKACKGKGFNCCATCKRHGYCDGVDGQPCPSPEPQLAVVEPEPKRPPFIAPVLDGDGNDTGLVCVFPGEAKGKKLQAERLAKAKRRYPR